MTINYSDTTLPSAVERFGQGVAEQPLATIARDLEHIEQWGHYKQWTNGSARVATVFGSARTLRGSVTYAMARELGESLADADWLVVTGGGPGIMQAVRDGAGELRSRAVRIEIPGERPETTLDVSRSITVESFALRKSLLIHGVDAIWAFPGGVGTMDELFEVLVLQDTGQIPVIPITLVEPAHSGYWAAWTSFVQKGLIEQRLVGEDILDKVVRVTSVSDALSVGGRV